jgi:thiol-disulfide isomerase/thioredoxin
MNVPQLVVAYGQLIAWGLLALALIAVIAMARRSRSLVPRSFGALLVYVLAAGLAFVSVQFLGWARLKVDPLKPVFHAAGHAAPELTFTTLEDGAVHRLADYRGQVVVLNLWATWCGPCRAEMPALDKLQRAHAHDGVVVITVSDEPAEALRRFPGYGAMAMVKGMVDTSRVHSALLVRAQVARPVTHLIDRDGVLRETLLEGQDLATFERKLQPLIKS